LILQAKLFFFLAKGSKWNREKSKCKSTSIPKNKKNFILKKLLQKNLCKLEWNFSSFFMKGQKKLRYSVLQMQIHFVLSWFSMLLLRIFFDETKNFFSIFCFLKTKQLSKQKDASQMHFTFNFKIIHNCGQDITNGQQLKVEIHMQKIFFILEMSQ
ncbi:hypothetical protein RFI_35970, partial [Reticulomyxa filosa]